MRDYKKELNLYFELRDTPESTRESHYRRISVFISYIEEQQKAVEDIAESDIQQFILHLKNEKGLSAGTINNYNSAIKFFYTHVLNREWNSKKIPRMKRQKKLPYVPCKEVILQLIDITSNIMYKAIISLLYGSGLRVGEVASLRIKDICSKTMQIRIDEAKHDTCRCTILSKQSLELLRTYFREKCKDKNYTPDDWLFPGRNDGEHLNVKSIKNTIIKSRNKLELEQAISAKTFRHAFATHALEEGVGLVHIMEMMGHKNISTTSGYLHLTSKSMMGIKSPLDEGGKKK